MSETDKIMSILKVQPKARARGKSAHAKAPSQGRAVAKQIDPVLVIRKGLPASAGRTVIRKFKLDDKRAEKIFGFSTRTLSRRAQANAALNPVQSDRVYRFARVAAHAEEVLGSEAKGQDWLLTYNRALGQAPVDLLDTDAGTEAVEEVLYRIEHGIFS